MPKPNEPRALAAIASVQPVLAGARVSHLFEGRGFSKRTIEAFVARGIDYTKRLLFMEKKALNDIPGIGKGGLAEISDYRQRILRRTVSQD
jgi:hypothetical protein